MSRPTFPLEYTTWAILPSGPSMKAVGDAECAAVDGAALEVGEALADAESFHDEGFSSPLNLAIQVARVQQTVTLARKRLE